MVHVGNGGCGGWWFFVNGEDIEVFVPDIVAVVDGVSNGGCGSWW